MNLPSIERLLHGESPQNVPTVLPTGLLIYRDSKYGHYHVLHLTLVHNGKFFNLVIEKKDLFKNG